MSTPYRGTVAVTGANGFIGSALVARLQRDGWDVLTVGRKQGCMKWVALNDGVPRWTAVLQGVDAVVHLAASLTSPSGILDDHIFERGIRDATLDIAQAAENAGVQRFVYMSMAEVYGPRSRPGQPFRVGDRLNPEDGLARCKMEAEDGVRQIAASGGSMQACVIRAPRVFGRGAKGVFGEFLKDLRKGARLPVGLADDSRRSYIGVRNLVDLVVRCVQSPEAANRTFNAGDSDPMSLREFAVRMERAAGRTPRTSPVPVLLLSAMSEFCGKGLYSKLTDNLELDWSRTSEILGWTPPYSLDEEMRAAMR